MGRAANEEVAPVTRRWRAPSLEYAGHRVSLTLVIGVALAFSQVEQGIRLRLLPDGGGGCRAAPRLLTLALPGGVA